MSTVTWTDAECRKHGLDTDAEILAGCREVQRLTSEVRKIVEGKGPVPRTKAEIMADIEAAALESVKKTGKVVTKGKAIATYMDTAEGRAATRTILSRQPRRPRPILRGRPRRGAGHRRRVPVWRWTRR
jgi:hypothetical protein